MAHKSEVGLVRALGLGALIVYGVGDILGAGIYAIIGKIAGHAGSYAWLSFAIAMAIVFLTALNYSELGSRFPKSGGVAIYVQEAFDTPWLSTLAGLLLFGATILSMATLSHAFMGYVMTLGFAIPVWLGIFCFLLTLLLINLRGIKQSSMANMISTFIEVSGLFMVIGFGLWYLLTSYEATINASSVMPGISQIFQGAALAFFAFTGFEDIANVAEEVREPEKNMPRAILSSIGLAGVLYLSVSGIATAIIPGHELGQSAAPLLDVVTKAHPSLPHYLFSLIAIFAVSNSTLLNYITASRLLYGMSKSKLLPTFLQTIHKKFHTPSVAIVLILPLVLALSLTSSLGELASSTSAVVLIVFSLSSAALARIKFQERKKQIKRMAFNIPQLVPYLAIALNLTAISFLPLRNIIPAALFIGIIGIITAFFVKSMAKAKK